MAPQCRPHHSPRRHWHMGSTDLLDEVCGGCLCLVEKDGHVQGRQGLGGHVGATEIRLRGKLAQPNEHTTTPPPSLSQAPHHSAQPRQHPRQEQSRHKPPEHKSHGRHEERCRGRRVHTGCLAVLRAVKLALEILHRVSERRHISR